MVTDRRCAMLITLVPITAQVFPACGWPIPTPAVVEVVKEVPVMLEADRTT